VLSARIAIATLIAAITCACGSTNSGERTGGPEVSQDTGSANISDGSGADRARARHELRDAVHRMDAAPSLGFRSVMSEAGQVIVTTTGMSGSDGWEAKTIAEDPSRGPLELRARSTMGSVWMTMPGWPERMRGCWMAMSKGEVPVGVLAMTPDEPAYVSILRYLRATRFSDQAQHEVEGTLGLRPAFYLLTGELAQHLHLTDGQANDGSTPVQVELGSGRVRSVTLSGDVFAAAIEKAGGNIDSSMGDVLNHLRVTVTYSGSPHEVHVTAPAPGVVMTVDDRGCSASSR
jgi:hypothetical protein